MENELTNNATKSEQNLPQTGEVLGQHESGEQYIKALQAISAEIDSVVEFAEQSTDWRDIRNRLADTKDKIKSLFLKEEDNDSLLTRIAEAFEKVNSRQAEEKDKLENASNENYNLVINKVKEAVAKSAKLNDFKKAREILLNAQNLFKNLVLKRSHRDGLNDLIHNAFDSLTKRQIDDRENYEMECIENYHNSKAIVEAALEFSLKSPHYGKAREALIEVQSRIKGLKLKREQRDELFQVIRDAFESVNKRQDEERATFETETQENYKKLKKIVDDAVVFANTSEEYSQSREMLINAQHAIKGMKLRRDQRDHLYAEIRRVFESLNERQSGNRGLFDKESQNNYHNLTAKVNDCFELVLGLTDFRMIRETLLNVQSEVKVAKLKRSHRNELFARVREAFGIYDKRRKEFFEARKSEKIEKLKEVKAVLNEKLDRLRDNLVPDKEAKDRCNYQLSSEEISEDEKSVLLRKIAGLASRIADKEKSIEQTLGRIAEVDAELDKVEKSTGD